ADEWGPRRARDDLNLRRVGRVEVGGTRGSPAGVDVARRVRGDGGRLDRTARVVGLGPAVSAGRVQPPDEGGPGGVRGDQVVRVLWVRVEVSGSLELPGDEHVAHRVDGEGGGGTGARDRGGQEQVPLKVELPDECGAGRRGGQRRGQLRIRVE